MEQDLLETIWLLHADQWDVLICDVDSSALERTKELIYPERYGQWDSQIELSLCSDLKSQNYDLVFIGTPPDTHMELAIRLSGRHLLFSQDRSISANQQKRGEKLCENLL